MTPEIKNRIEKIQKGEVPEGYTKDKLGVVPKDWEKISFSTLLKESSNFTDNLEEYPLYSLTIEDGITPKTERYERSHLVKKENAYKIMLPDDYAYNPMNIRFGAVARHKGNFPVSVSGYYDIFTTKHKSDLAFMDSFLTCDSMLTYYNKVSTGSLIEKQRVHFSQFINFNLPLPKLEERKKIADILTTQDKIIELKEKLLEEKKKQKKYLMQQLLTGKKRLKGFNSEWKIIELKKVLIENDERTCSNNQYKILSSTVNGVMLASDYYQHRQRASKDNTGYKILKKNQLVFSPQNIWLGNININLTYDIGIVSPSYKIFDIEKNHLPQFWGYLLKTHQAFRKYDTVLSSGASVCRKNLDTDAFLDLSFCVPSKTEQIAIADILSTADKEIDLLEKDIEAEKQKKKALMQLLLTGIVRVK